MKYEKAIIVLLRRVRSLPWFVGQRLGQARSSPQLGTSRMRTPILLEWRLTALGLNPREIKRSAPDAFANLESTCANCADKRRCLDDMMESLNPSGWESYCPNSGTIRTFL